MIKITEKMYFTAVMEELYSMWLEGSLPLLVTAIHDGHFMRDNLSRYSVLDEAVRLREEDPFTGIWTRISGNRIVVNRSRFEFDLNRPPEKAVYRAPADAWGLELWKSSLPPDLFEESLSLYREFYETAGKAISNLVRKFGRLVVYDLHSYNYRRTGPDKPPEDPLLNPEINLGTGTMDRVYWSPVVESFLYELGKADFKGRRLDIRENVKFKGGYFPKWIHENFSRSVCCLSIEVKKIFMDEWTGTPDPEAIDAIGDALRGTIQGVLKVLPEIGSTK